MVPSSEKAFSAAATLLVATATLTFAAQLARPCGAQANSEWQLVAALNPPPLRSGFTFVPWDDGEMLLFGGETLRDFVIVLLLGVIVGTYSSIFIAANVLVAWNDGGLTRMAGILSTASSPVRLPTIGQELLHTVCRFSEKCIQIQRHSAPPWSRRPTSNS